MTLTRFRGTREQPGLMMALDRGGCCHGVVYRLPDENHADQLGRLVRRETSTRRSTNTARWITVDTDLGKLRALAFTASPEGITYAGKLPAEHVARILARAAGHWRSGASYLFQTITKLEEFGMHDANLWRLQQLVADEILAMTKPPEGGARRWITNSLPPRASSHLGTANRGLWRLCRQTLEFAPLSALIRPY
jgi:cation transport protein ChaC